MRRISRKKHKTIRQIRWIREIRISPLGSKAIPMLLANFSHNGLFFSIIGYNFAELRGFNLWNEKSLVCLRRFFNMAVGTSPKTNKKWSR